MVLKGLIFVGFHLGEGMIDLKGLNQEDFYLGGFDGVERTDFGLLADSAWPNQNL